MNTGDQSATDLAFKKRLELLVLNVYDANCAVTVAEEIPMALEKHPVTSDGLFWPYVSRSSRDFVLLVLSRIVDTRRNAGISAKRVLEQAKADPRRCTRTWQTMSPTKARAHISSTVDPWITWLDEDDVIRRVNEIRDKHLAHQDKKTIDLSFAYAVVSLEEVKTLIEKLELMVNDLIGLVRDEQVDWHMARRTAEEMAWIMKMCADGVEARRKEREQRFR